MRPRAIADGFVGAAAWLVVATLGGAVIAEERSFAVRVDELIEARFAGQPAAPVCSDAEFLRRAWLDFAGGIPPVGEVRAFLADASPDKRTKLIARLLAAPTYPERMAEQFHVTLMERRGDDLEWQRWLRESFEQHRPWDRMVRELLDSSLQDPERPDGGASAGASLFVTKRLEANGQNPIDHPGLTRDVGRLFLGIDLQCAQCHDHLFIGDYKQVEFQGLFAVLKTLSVQQVPASGTTARRIGIVEKASETPLEFVSVFESLPKSTGPRVPFLKDLPLPVTRPDVEPQATPPQKGGGIRVSPVLPTLAAELANPQNPLFARNIANRLWGQLMGRGLVHPFDLHHSGNPPSHPELLDLLAQEFVAGGCDIRRFLGELARTRTYQRGGAWPEGSGVDPAAVPPESYRVFQQRRLSAEQWLRSAIEATGNAARLRADVPYGGPQPEHAKLRKRVLEAFANEPKEPEDRLDPSVKGALFVLNDAEGLDLWKPRPGSLVERTLALTDNRRAAEELFLSVLGRPPTEEEAVECVAFLSAADGPSRERRIVLWGWSLLASTEFATNH